MWRIALAPLLLSVLALTLAAAGLLHFSGSLYAIAAGWLPTLEVESGIEWLWIGPARAGLWLLGTSLFVGLCGALVVATWLVAGVLAAPFHEILSQRVEDLLTGSVRDASAPGLRGIVQEGVRAGLEEARRLVFFVGAQGVIFVLGIVIPGGQLVAPLAMLLFAVLFLPLDYASYTLDRRHVSFAEKRRWVAQHREAMLGFGAAALLTFWIPGLNFFAMPVLVVAGTLLALRLPTTSEREAV